jgi:hypothetical protein
MIDEKTVVGEEITKESLFDVLERVDSQTLQDALYDFKQERWRLEVELGVVKAKETIIECELRERDTWSPF